MTNNLLTGFLIVAMITLVLMFYDVLEDRHPEIADTLKLLLLIVILIPASATVFSFIGALFNRLFK